MTTLTEEGTQEGAPKGAGAVREALEARVPDQSRAARRASFDVADFAVPSGREEDWRFTPLDRLAGLHSGAAASGDAPLVEHVAPGGVTVEVVGRDDERLGRTGTPEDRIAAQAWSSFERAAVLTVARGAEVAEPAYLTVTGRGGLAYAHLAVVAQAQSSAVVVIDHRGSGALAANVEIDLGDAAHLTLVSVQDWADDAVHVSAHHARLGRDARLKHVVVTLGGDVVRVTPSARFTAPGSEVEMLGLYFADAGQHLEHRLFVDHAVPHCRSNVTYKGALQGDSAHTVWVGDVLIRAAAEGTDTYELNRNLVLTDGARADSVPNLEIETGEIVGAGHASATGRFDDEQLFYLQSRGIPELEARRLVVRGFFFELIQKIGVPQVQDRLVAAIEAELEKSIGTPPASVAGAALPGGRVSAQRVCSVGDVPVPGAVRVVVDGVPVAVVRDEGGDLHAVGDTCTHADVSLSEGEVDDCSVECWLHGSRFDLRTGEPTALPAIRPIPVFPVSTDGDGVFVDVSTTINAGETAVKES